MTMETTPHQRQNECEGVERRETNTVGVKEKRESKTSAYKLYRSLMGAEKECRQKKAHARKEKVGINVVSSTRILTVFEAAIRIEREKVLET